MKCKENRWVFFIDLNIASGSQTWAYEQTFFPLAQNFFPFSNLNPFPFKPRETKIGEVNFYEMKESFKVVQPVQTCRESFFFDLEFGCPAGVRHFQMVSMLTADCSA